ncbi:hypothetical protein [Halomarina rubra]|uniref:DUF4395 domain-containing protein n=1 Tax=Halomarina rubra TaxID=2071873 RepID=A0ABD6AYT4_9EURY|nr:hypothetical protein [Halomarina rubra]
MASPRSRYPSSSDEPPPTASAEYRPGYCNIGHREQRRRYRYAGVGALVTLVYLSAVLAASAPAGLVVGAFAPLALAYEFFVQARAQFCVKFAVLGRYDFTGSGGEAGRVADPENRRADTTSAIRITVVSVVAAGVTTGVLYALVESL